MSRIFEHNFSDNNEKGRRHTVLCLVLLTQLAGKFAKKTCIAKELLGNKLNNLDKYKCSSYFLTVPKILNRLLYTETPHKHRFAGIYAVKSIGADNRT